MRKSSLFLLYLAASTTVVALMFAHAAVREKDGAASLNAKAEFAGRLELTDLCLFTEASYTRHPSQADLHTPFQSGPVSFDHFPSGALMPPPAVVRKVNGKVD